MSNTLFLRLGGVLTAIAVALGATAQNSYPAPGGGNSAPAPGSGGSFNPAPPNGIGWNPGPAIPGGPGWGNPWGPGWSNTAPVIVNTPLSSPTWQNSGITNVVACGYDAQGIWRTLPLKVQYDYNGVQYDVMVLNAWNPWTDMWDIGVDDEAYNTNYFLNGTYFDFYVVLSTGTYYFNL